MNAQEDPGRRPLIGIVGPCGSGKSTLIAGLVQAGYACRHIAQEHSYVKDMWKRISHPDLLIYLHASYEIATLRRRLNWTKAEYAEQLRRLEHARQHANLCIDTDGLSIEAVRQRAIDYLKKHP